MTNFQIEFTHPWLLLLLVPALFFALFPYFRLSKKYRKTRNRITSIVLHMLVMVLSISVLSGINFKYELPNTRNELILLVDGSFSGSETEEAKNNFVQAVLNECEPEMRVGIVTFGFNQVYAAPLTTDKSRAYRQYLEAEKPDGSATDIASALQYAGGIFENPQSGKIVLLTDGDETDRSASAVIRTIAASGITVDTVHFPAERNDSEVLITGVTLPDYNVVVEDSFKIGLTLQSSFVGAANVTLLDNGEPVGEPHAIELVSGTQTVEFEHVFHEQGLHALSFEISNDRDTLTQNNIFNSYIYLEVFDDLLIIERNADESAALAEILGEQFNVSVVNVFNEEEMPTELDELRQYDEIILMNIANADMPAGFDSILYSYVNEIGGGLFTVGGNREDGEGGTIANTYDRQDMAGTLYQQMLPVQAIDYTPPVGVVIIIDRSGSMDMRVEGSGGKTKLDLAKEGAMSSLLSLTERDYCSVMTLEDDYNEDLEMTPLPQRAKIEAAIEKIEIGGGTIFTGALERAGAALRGLRSVERRHIILVTDGEPGDSFWTDPINQVGGYGGAIKNNALSGITLSIVAIGVDSKAAQTMKEATELGGGEFYNVWDATTLPGIMREDMDIPQIIAYNPEPFTPKVRDHNSVLNGVDESLLPELGGFYGTKVKSGASVPLMAEYVPVLAQWKFGNGMVASFMCDLNGTWSSEFLESETGRKILNNLVNCLFPVKNIKPGAIDTRMTEENYITSLSVYASLEESETLEITVTEQTGTAQPSVQKFNPTVTDGFGKVEFVITNPGVHEIAVQIKNADGSVAESYTTYKSFSYSQEYNVFTDDEENARLLELIAARGGGAVVSSAQPWKIFDDFQHTLEHEFDPRWAFIIAALALFLLDIAVRKFKFKWLHEIVRDRKLKKELGQNKK